MQPPTSPPPVSPPPRSTTPPKGKLSQGQRIALIGIPVGLVALFVIAYFAGQSRDDGVWGSVRGHYAANPASLNFTVVVHNDTDEDRDVECSVDATDSSGTYSGFDTFDVGTVPADGKEIFAGTLTIENSGAEFVTVVTADC